MVKPLIKPGDYHLVVNATRDDALQACPAKLFDSMGNVVRHFECLPQGVNGPAWHIPGGDTPAGLYRVGYVRQTQAWEAAHLWHAFGEWYLDLEGVPGLSAPEEAVGRSGIGMHGGSSALLLRYADRLLPLLRRTGALAARQPLRATHGCIRFHNEDAEDLARLWQKLKAAGRQLYVSVVQE